MLVALACAQNHSQSLQLVTLWNWFGIADLVIASGTGFLSATSRFQVFALADRDGRTGNVLLSSSGAVPLNQALPLWDQAQQILRGKLGEDVWLQTHDTLAKLAESAKGRVFDDR